MEKRFDVVHHFNFNQMEAMASVPVYSDVQNYASPIGDMHIWEDDGSKAESMSWKESCFIHSDRTKRTIEHYPHLNLERNQTYDVY